MKKILCIMHLPPPLHGASQSNANVAGSAYLKAHFDIHIINLQFAKSLADLRRLSIKKVTKAIGYGAKIFAKVLAFKPDLVYFTLSPNGFAFYRDAMYVFILKLLRTKTVFFLHGKGIGHNADKSLLKKSLYRMVFKNIDVICITNKLTKDIDNVSTVRPFIVAYGIPVHHSASQTGIERNNSCVRILYLSNYKETKGILLLVDVLTVLKSDGYVFHARLVGGPSDLSISDLNNYVKKKNMENSIDVVGPLYNDEKYNEFKNADIFVFPTYYANETFGLVNLEAMEFGLPIITTDEGGISEVVINGESGFVIEPKNPQELTEKLSILIKDKNLREEMGRNGKNAFFDRFTLLHFEENLKNVFETIINR